MTSVRLKKAVKDNFRNAPRAIMSILAIAVGVIGIGTVIAAYSVLSREMAASYKATCPAISAVETNAGAERILPVVAGVEGVIDAEPRGMYRGRIAVGKDEWRPIILFVINNYNNMRLNIIRPEKGSWPPLKGDILIERSALKVANIELGSTLLVEIPGVRSVDFTAAGIVYDAGQAPAWMEGSVYGYITRESLALFGIRELNRVIFSTETDHEHDEAEEAGNIHDKIKNRLHSTENEHDAADRPSSDQISSKIIDALAGQGIPATLVAAHAHDAGSVPKAGAHPHDGQMKALLFLLGAFGGLAFLLSGLTVFTMMSSMMAKEVRAIGIMKSIGGRISDIGLLYFTGVFLIACAALVPAIPAALIIADKYILFAAGMLNFNITDPNPSVWFFPLIIFLGFSLPLLSAAVPIIRGIRKTSAGAMSDYGISKSSPGDIKGKIRFEKNLSIMITMPLRNLVRSRARSLMTILMLAAGGVVFMAALNTGASIKATLREIDRSLKYDVEIKLAKFLPEKEISAAFALNGVSKIETWSDITGCRVDGTGMQGRQFRILAVPENSDMIGFPVVSGRWFKQGETGAAIANQRWLAAEHGIRTGDGITIRVNGNDKQIHVIGAIRMISASTMIVPYSMLKEYSSLGLANSVRISSNIDTAELMRSINVSAGKAGIPISIMFAKSQYKKAMEDHFIIIVSFLIFMAVFIIIVGAIGLSSTISIAVLERYREIGILCAVGGSTRQILGLIIYEGLFMGLLSYLLALAFVLPVSMAIGTTFIRIFLQTSINFAFAPLSLIIWFAVLLVVVLVAAILPARKAASLPVREALVYE